MNTFATVKKWSFWFKERPDKANVTNTPTADSSAGDIDPGKIIQQAAVYYQRLAAAASGYYPLNAHGLWHGGIHFDMASGLKWTQSIHNLADGQVVATRLNHHYVPVNEADSSVCLSSGFVLIRHCLTLPDASQTRADITPAEKEDDANTSASLTFYSLYMHMLPWNAYQQQGVTLPSFWGTTYYQIKEDKKTDRLLGVRIRPVQKSDAKRIDGKRVLCVVVRGSVLRLGKPLTADSPYRKVEEIVSGCAFPAWEGVTDGYCYTPELTPLRDKPAHWRVGEKAKDAPEDRQAQAVRGQYIRETEKNNSAILALLLPDKKVTLGESGGSRRKLKTLATADATVPPLIADKAGNLPGWLATDAMRASETVPDAFDTVRLLTPPAPIGAGECVGYPGAQQLISERASQFSGEPLLHLDVFSADDVPAFIRQSRAFAETLADNQKNWLSVARGALLYQPAAADIILPAGSDVELLADSPKDGPWVKVKSGYFVTIADRNTGLGKYSKPTYVINAQQKAAIMKLANIAHQDSDDIPNHVTLVSQFDEKNKNARLVKFSRKDAKPCWIRSDALNEQGQRKTRQSDLPAWSDYPLANPLNRGEMIGIMRVLSLADIDKQYQAVNGKNHWWYVTGVNEQGGDVQGWVKEGSNVTRCSPWHWPGFECIEDHSQPADQIALSVLTQTEQGESSTRSEENLHQLRLHAASARQNQLMQTVQRIMGNDALSGAPKTSINAMQNALAKPWIAEPLSRLIIKTKSEWHDDGTLSPWETVFKLLDPDNQQSKRWDFLRHKIRKLIWYPEVAETLGLPADGRVWHFHPVGVVSGFIGTKKVNVTVEMLRRVFESVRNKKDALLTAIANEINENSELYRLDTLQRLNHFFAQVREEVGPECQIDENFNYTPEGLMIFTYFQKNPADAQRYGRKLGQKAQQVAIANRAYGNTGNRSLGNGSIASGDGWRYRGRGLKQLTGKKNYERFTRQYKSIWHGDEDFVANPDLLLEVRYAIRSAVFFWLAHKLYDRADKGNTQEIVNSITRGINKYTNSYLRRWEHFRRLERNNVFNGAFLI